MRGRESIECEPATRSGCELAPDVPLRMHGVLGFVPDKRGERLVQPDVVPPRERREVAPPHVGQLVRDRAHAGLQAVRRGPRRIDCEQIEAVRDRAGIFHRAGGEIGDADAFDLVIRIGDAGVVLEPLDRRAMGIACIDALSREAGRKPDAHRRAVTRRHGIGAFERADGDHQEVGRERRGLREAPVRAAASGGPPLDGARVRDRRQVRWRGQLEGEAGLERRLVEAREDSPRLGWEHDRHGEALGSAGRAVQPFEVGTNCAGELRLDRERSRLEACRGFENDRLRLVVMREPRS